MDPNEILKRLWHEQLIATLDVLHANPTPQHQGLTIAAACQALENWLQTIPNAQPPLARNRGRI